MQKFLLGGVFTLVLLAPAPAWAHFPRWRQVTTVQYVSPAPVVAYPVPAPVATSYYAGPPVAPVVTYAPPAPAVITTTYTYRAPLLRPFYVPPPPVVIVRP